jgi:hypothetical protein
VPPFQADTPHRFVMLHASERPKALRTVNPSVTASPELEAVIFKALEKDRGARFATAREFARALEALLPSLDDTPGAPPPVPTGSDVTEEPTRVSARNVATVVTMQTVANAQVSNAGVGNAPVQPPPPSKKSSFAHLTMERTPLEPAPPAPPPSRPARQPGAKGSGSKVSRWKAGAIVAVVAAITAGLVATFRPSPSPATPSSTVTVETQRASAVPAIPTAQGHVGINAFPWGRITSIRNLDNNATVELPANLVTPVPVDLAPGRYAITLENPNFRTVTETVEVRPNEESMVTARFANPAQAQLPLFEAPR